jgi:hypothetical protein
VTGETARDQVTRWAEDSSAQVQNLAGLNPPLPRVLVTAFEALTHATILTLPFTPGTVVLAEMEPASCHSVDPDAHLSLRGDVTITLIVVVPGVPGGC